MLKLLRRIIHEIDTAQNFNDALQIIVRYIRQSLDTQACSVFLIGKTTSEFVLVATDGLNESAIGKIRVPLQQGLLGRIFKTERIVNLPNAKIDPDFLPIPAAQESHVSSFLGVPIQRHQKMLGVLVVQGKEERQFDAAEVSFLTTLAIQLARIIPKNDAASTAITQTESATPKSFSLYGAPCVPGVAIGQGVLIFQHADLDSVPHQKTKDPDLEIVNFQQALQATREEMQILGERLTTHLPQEEKELFDAYAKILDSPSLRANVIKEIRTGIWAPTALRRVIKHYSRSFETMDNEYFSERIDDLKDLACRILAHLQAEGYTKPKYPNNTILVGENITAANLAEVPEGKLAGIISTHGSGSSHVSVLARALGIPTVMGVSELKLETLQEKPLIVDGYFGKIYISPQPKLLETFQALAQEENELAESLKHLNELPAQTKDGHHINIFVNTGLMANIGHALTIGADGVGLYRTEVPFMIRECFPSEEEQRINYRQLLTAFAPKPVTMRILDIGGDKALPYFPIQETNPFLGWRGIRMMLDHTEILLTQLRAMLLASEGLDNLNIMLPMVTDISEVNETIKLLDKVYQEVLIEHPAIQKPKLGVMIEVPSAVYQARTIAEKVDFLSVGSNDLTQYILAVDRNNEHVTNLFDSLHPAVLQALMQAVEGGHLSGKPVSICGEMAGDPASAILLLAMGFDAISMSAPNLPRIKWVIREFKLSDAKRLLADVLTMENSWQIRTHLEQALDQAGLGGLIRAGRH